jgi:hypothetical protein
MAEVYFSWTVRAPGELAAGRSLHDIGHRVIGRLSRICFHLLLHRLRLRRTALELWQRYASPAGLRPTAAVALCTGMGSVSSFASTRASSSKPCRAARQRSPPQCIAMAAHWHQCAASLESSTAGRVLSLCASWRTHPGALVRSGCPQRARAAQAALAVCEYDAANEVSMTVHSLRRATCVPSCCVLTSADAHNAGIASRLVLCAVVRGGILCHPGRRAM